jgi:transcriptional regulator with XRE-family HTH domain
MTAIVGTEELGRRMRKLRIERRMTLKQVEQAANLSATHLSEIERGRTSPTIGALVRIARALDKDASYFIEAEERSDVAHVTREGARHLAHPDGVSLEALTPGVPGSGIFAYRINLDGRASEGLAFAAQDAPGDAIFYVRRGTLEAEFGVTKLTLSEGDAVQATFLGGHRFRPAAGSSAEVIAVLTRSLEER